MSDIIEISRLSKRFGDVQAVNDLSFRVKEGELFAFLGINGAGKSTTINIMCGQLSKDSGTVQIDGVDLDRDPDGIKRNLGVVFQNSVLDKDLSVQDNLQSRGALYGIQGKAFRQRLAELADVCGIGGENEAEKANAFIRWIEETNKKMGLPDSFDVIREEDIDQMIAWASKEANPLYPVPVVWSKKDFRRFIQSIRR